jgi:hypothetical protein
LFAKVDEVHSIFETEESFFYESYSEANQLQIFDFSSFDFSPRHGIQTGFLQNRVKRRRLF